MSKWLDIYSGVLMVRVLLSWFPNIPWDRQPLSAIRDLCDPYLNLFRNIIPLIFDTLDVSPLLAFEVLGVLGSIRGGMGFSYGIYMGQHWYNWMIRSTMSSSPSVWVDLQAEQRRGF